MPLDAGSASCFATIAYHPLNHHQHPLNVAATVAECQRIFKKVHDSDGMKLSRLHAAINLQYKLLLYQWCKNREGFMLPQGLIREIFNGCASTCIIASLTAIALL